MVSNMYPEISTLLTKESNAAISIIIIKYIYPVFPFIRKADVSVVASYAAGC